jgi:transposase
MIATGKGVTEQTRPYVRGVKAARPRGKLNSGVALDWPEPSPTLKRGRTMKEDSVIFIGLDTSKLKISVAVADGERNGEVRFFGEISSEPASVASMVAKLSKRGAKLHFCYEAGPTGYGLYRQIIELGHDCVVVAPSLVPRRPGGRVKTNRRDAVSLARLHRAGELTSVWVPDEGHEAIRDLVRAREAGNDALKQARQQLQSFLLRHGRAPTSDGWRARPSITPPTTSYWRNIARPSRMPACVWTG